jgi:hypothetical protein
MLPTIMASVPPSLAARRERDRRKAKTFYKKVVDSRALENEVKLLRDKVRDHFKKTATAYDLDVAVAELRKPERREPPAHLDAKNHRLFIRRERIKHRRQLHDWYATEKTRLNSLLAKGVIPPLPPPIDKVEAEALCDDLMFQQDLDALLDSD